MIRLMSVKCFDVIQKVVPVDWLQLNFELWPSPHTWDCAITITKCIGRQGINHTLYGKFDEKNAIHCHHKHRFQLTLSYSAQVVPCECCEYSQPHMPCSTEVPSLVVAGQGGGIGYCHEGRGTTDSRLQIGSSLWAVVSRWSHQERDSPHSTHTELHHSMSCLSRETTASWWMHPLAQETPAVSLEHIPAVLGGGGRPGCYPHPSGPPLACGRGQRSLVRMKWRWDLAAAVRGQEFPPQSGGCKHQGQNLDSGKQNK